MSGISKTKNDLFKKFESEYKKDPLRFQDLPGTSENWDPLKLVQLYKLSNADPKPTQEEIAAIVQFNRSTVARKTTSMDWEEFSSQLEKLCNMTDEEYIAMSAENERYKNLAEDALKKRSNYIDNVAFMQHIEARISKMTKALPVHTLDSFKAVKRNNKTRTPEHVVLLLSDLHVGQEFSTSDTGGLNEYNIDITKKRMEKLQRGVASIFEHHSELYELPELHIFALGDFVQGSNLGGAWGPAYNSNIDIHEQAVIAGEYISQFLMTLSQYFKQINFTGVIGNHGRAGVAKNSDKVSANWDNIVYALVKARLANYKNINIDYTKSWWAQKNVNGTEFLLVHGDYIGSSMASLQKEEQRMQSLLSSTTSRRFNYMCCGHFHSHQEIETSMGGIIVNGSFVGGDVHSMHQLRNTSRPTQTLLGVHPVRGITWKYKIDLR